MNFYSPEVTIYQSNQEYEDSARLSIVGQLTDFPTDYEERIWFGECNVCKLR